MSSPQHQLDFIHGCIDQLEDYLLSDQLYWQVSLRSASGSPPYPQLTLGNLLLFQHQAAAWSEDAESARRLSQYSSEIDVIRTRWISHWRKKASSEVQARIKLWRDYLQEYRKDPEGNFDRYEYEVTRRAMLEWLLHEAGPPESAEQKLLSSLDQILKNLLVKGEFIWDVEMRSEFPKEVFWYLYGKLPDSWPGPA